MPFQSALVINYIIATYLVVVVLACRLKFVSMKKDLKGVNMENV